MAQGHRLANGIADKFLVGKVLRQRVLIILSAARQLHRLRSDSAVRYGIAASLLLFATSLDATAQTSPPSVQSSVEFDIADLKIIWLTPWGSTDYAREWQNIIVHQSEGPSGSAHRMALRQIEKPDRRGATIWVDTDGTVYWAVAEFAAPSHVRGNRNDNKYIDNNLTFQKVDSANSIGIEFVGNYPNVRRPATAAQADAWLKLAQLLCDRYKISVDRIYAHAWVDFRDKRYCEGCELATMARSSLHGLMLSKASTDNRNSHP